uniref:Uncharacterized protein n=1 Tax=Romanomermis culicivorax TaxID=13658 RepID=A0A915HJF2_ROMCU
MISMNAEKQTKTVRQSENGAKMSLDEAKRERQIQMITDLVNYIENPNDLDIKKYLWCLGERHVKYTSRGFNTEHWSTFEIAVIYVMSRENDDSERSVAVEEAWRAAAKFIVDGMKKADVKLENVIVVSPSRTGYCSTSIFERYFGYVPNRNLSQLIYRNTTFGRNANLINSCKHVCQGETSCQGFAIDFHTLLCSLYENIPEKSANFFQTQLSSDLEKSFFIKICFTEDLAPCQNSLPWQMDLVPLATIRFLSGADNFDGEFGFGNATNVTDMEECQTLCLVPQKVDRSEQEVSSSPAICRSAVYDFKEKICILSQENRRSSPNAIMLTKDDKIYMENRCMDKDTTDACSFTEKRDGSITFSRGAFRTKSRRQCESMCSKMVDFSCRGYQYNRSSKYCKFSLGSAAPSIEIWKLLENQTADDAQNFDNMYYEKSDCLDVKLFCLKNSMVVQITVDNIFDGKIFDSNNRCHFSDFNADKFNISLSLIDQAKCRLFNEYLYTCSRDAKDDIVSEVTHNVVQSDATSPTASIKIVDVDGNLVTKAKIGQVLYAQIMLEESIQQDTKITNKRGLFINDCATLENGQKVQLLDHIGCPLDRSLFESFKPVAEGNFQILRAAFKGFKFRTQRKINLSCNTNCTTNVRRRSKRALNLVHKSVVVETSIDMME